MDISLGPQSVMPEAPSTLRLAQLRRLLWRYSWLIGVCAVIGAVGAYVYAGTVPKTYTASTAITVEGEHFAIPELQGALRTENAPDPMPWVRTEVQALTSRELISTVIDRLHLANNPEFNAALLPPTLLQQIKARVQALLPTRAASPASAAPDEIVLNAVTHALAVFQDNRSLVIGLTFTSRDPALSAEFLNQLVGTYVRSRASNRSNANEHANDVMVARTAQARADLDAIEREMQELRDKSEMVNLRAGSIGQQQLEELATAAARASLERSQLQANWERASALSKQGLSDALLAVLNSSTISRLRDQESVASSRVAELSSRYGRDYPAVRSATADLQAVQRQLGGEVQRIVASMGAQLKVARDQEAQVQQQLAEARRAAVQSGSASAKLTQLQQEAQTRRTLYQTLLERSQQTVAQPANTATPDVRVLSAAFPPGNPSGPNTKIISAAGGAFGCLFGCLLALTRIRSSQSVEDAGKFSRRLGVTVLAAVPRALMQTGRKGLASIATARPPGAGAEIARSVRAQLRFAGRSSTPRAVLFMSEDQSNAASIVAAAVARVAAADGERVLLIEGSLDRPRLGAVLGASGSGLASVLTGGADWRDMLTRDRNEGPDLLLAGFPVADLHVVLRSVALQNLLIEAREDYDFVVLDAPSASRADIAILAQRVDALVLVADRRTRPVELAGIVEQLGEATRTPLQAVLVA